jgi:serine/threonine-protein kinase
MKSAFWKTDWFPDPGRPRRLVSTAERPAANLERKAYDLGVQATSRNASDRSRSSPSTTPASATSGAGPGRAGARQMTDLLAGAGEGAVSTVFFSEAQVDPGYAYVTRLLELPAAKRPAQPGWRRSWRC